MATTADLGRVTAIVLRYMRPPVLVLVVVYAIGITGMALLPGQDAEGNPEYMSLFHAFYFFTYTATTTGFGEIPSDFTDEQRLWAIFCLYMGVIAWLYAIGKIIKLVQNPHFVQAVAERQFARTVRRISEPFFIICGFGDTGSLLARGLNDNFLTAVIIDSDSERVKALAMRDYRVKMPGLCADASVPKHLVDAGIKLANCRAIVAFTNDEDINLKIAVMARFLNPSLQVICRSTTPSYQQHLRSLGEVYVVDPFELFAEQLSTIITAPRLYTLGEWLVCARGVRLDNIIRLPVGAWILCGYGRMGKWLHKYFAKHQISTVVIDPRVERIEEAERTIKGHADPITLKEAGIEQVAGIVAGTDRDSDNLSILLSVRALNTGAFTIVRQNNHENQLAFDGASADLIMQPSLLMARKVLLLLISPLTQMLLDHLREQGEQRTAEVIKQLQVAVGDEKPHLWSVNMNRSEAVAVAELWDNGRALTFGDLIRNPHNLQGTLSCVPWIIKRGEGALIMPPPSQVIQPGDKVLFCGTWRSEQLLGATLNNPQTLDYLLTGVDAPRGYFFTWLARRKSQRKSIQRIGKTT